MHRLRFTPSCGGVSSSLASSTSSSLSFMLLLASSKQTYVTQQWRNREWSLMPEEDLELLGYSKKNIAPSKQELALAFKKELSNIMSETAAMIHESQKLSETNELTGSKSHSGAAEVLKEGSWNQQVEDRTMATIADRLEVGEKTLRDKLIGALHEKHNSSNTINGYKAEQNRLFADPEKIMQVRDERIARLVKAFRNLNNSRYSYLYDSAAQVSPEVMLGHKRSDESFANFDSRRQEFFFQKKEAKPLADFTDAYRQSTGLEDGDMEGVAEIAELTTGGFGEDMDNIRGTNIQFTLRLAFLEAFVGCTKTIGYRRRTSCTFCKGSGMRRQKAQRCPQCHGRGQLQLPSGSALVEKNCSLCLGSGSTLPPECSACKGTGLGPVENCKQTVHVPPGAQDGDSLNLRQKGHAGAKGGEPGNCYVTLIIQPHRLFFRDKHDLHVIIPCPLSVVLAGGEVKVPVLDDQGESKKISVVVENGIAVNSGINNREENSEEQEQQQTSSSFSSSSSSPMMSDRLIVLPEYGMWKEGPVGRNGDIQMVRGSLYVHCVGVVPKFSDMSKAQRHILMNYFGGLEEDERQKSEKLMGKEQQKQKQQRVLEDSEKSKEAFSQFAFAKEMCKHWLPGGV